jgi:hypothetical protein
MALTKEGCAMPKKSKKYVVRLTDTEREMLQQIVGKFKGSSQKVRRAQMLLKSDADGPDWTDTKIAEAFGCRAQTLEKIRERFVTQGFELTVNGRPLLKPPREKLLDGEQEAKLIAMRLGSPPSGFSNWSLRLLAERVVALEIVESISYETVRRTLKKTA